MAKPATDFALTARHREILDLVAEGLTNGQIARRVGLTENSIKGHLLRLSEKLGAVSRTQLAVMVQRSKPCALCSDAPPPTDAVVSLTQKQPSVRSLTTRELQVLEHMAFGLDVEELAKALGLSPNTVKTHIRRMRRALAATNRVHLLALAFRSGQLRLVPGGDLRA